MIDESVNPWETKSSRDLYENKWIKLAEHQVITPSGTDGIYGVVSFKNLAVGIIPVDEELHTWLVGQYRYPLQTYSWEIIEGGAPLDEDPLEAAKRELKEETGIVAQRYIHLMDLHTSNSVTDEKGTIYIAMNLTFLEAQPEETEQLQVKRVPLSEVLEMVLSGKITDSLSVASILKFYAITGGTWQFDV